MVHGRGRARRSDGEAAPPGSFNGINESLSLGQIVDRLGPASEVTGSGLCIFVWRVTDGREFWVGTENCNPSRPPIYAKFR